MSDSSDREKGGRPFKMPLQFPTDALLKEEVKRLRKLSFTWQRIINHINKSRQWFFEWRKRVDFRDPRGKQISDELLDDLIGLITEGKPECGLVMTIGYLRAIRPRIRVTRARISASMLRVDPEGRARRSH